MKFNHTTPQTSPPKPANGRSGFYILIPVVLLVLIGCFVGTVLYVKKRLRSDELRHMLIPLYTYDPAEGDDWGDGGTEEEEEEEEEEVAELLYSDGDF